MRPVSPATQSLPLEIVGSNKFGRYPKISYEQTINMIISDDALVPYAGYVSVATLAQNDAFGRGLYSSPAYNHMIAVIGNLVFAIDTNLNYRRIGSIGTSGGDVFIDENNAGQIAICDKSSLYIFNYLDSTFIKVALDFTPGYVTFQDGYFIAPALGTNRWRLSDPNNGLLWPAAPSNVGLLQTKPDTTVATVRVPGKGNQLFVFGNNVTESWYDVGYQLFPYQRSTYDNIDYGVLSSATIATNQNMVVWLSQNEKSGPAIVVSDGRGVNKISTDGIDYLLANLSTPSDSYAFFFRQDGHLIYQITFQTDNLSLAYDFNTQKFFTLTDIEGNFHIARHLVFFNETYYFVSAVDGNIYEMTTNDLTYNGNEIPRTRICPTIALPDRSRFVVQSITFPIEQGQESLPQTVYLSMSLDGGQSFGNSLGNTLNPTGIAQNRLVWWQCGSGNEYIPQFRFYGKSRFIAKNGEITIFQ